MPVKFGQRASVLLNRRYPPFVYSWLPAMPEILGSSGGESGLPSTGICSLMDESHIYSLYLDENFKFMYICMYFIVIIWRIKVLDKPFFAVAPMVKY